MNDAQRLAYGNALSRADGTLDPAFFQDTIHVPTATPVRIGLTVNK